MKVAQSSHRAVSLSEHVYECPICGHRDRKHFGKDDYLGCALHYWICQQCGLVYLSPRMAEQDAFAFYAEEYRLDKTRGADPVLFALTRQARRVEHQLGLLKAFLDRPPRVHVDVGTGVGTLVRAIRDEFGCDSYGVEPDRAVRDYACAHGLEMFPSLAALRETSSVRPDLITMSHVLEHIHQPVAMLREFHSFMTDDSTLLIEVPNLFFHHSFELTHLYAFSADVLVELLRHCGFLTVEQRVHGKPGSRIFPSYITVIAQPIDPPKESNYTSGPDRKSLYRHLGMFAVKGSRFAKAIPKGLWKRMPWH